MKLEWIKTTECPDCGCSQVIAESVDKEPGFGKPSLSRHANGQTWEKRTFLCGLTVSWIPNFASERVYMQCTQTREAKARLRRRQELQREIDQLHRQLQELS